MAHEMHTRRRRRLCIVHSVVHVVMMNDGDNSLYSNSVSPLTVLLECQSEHLACKNCHSTCIQRILMQHVTSHLQNDLTC